MTPEAGRNSVIFVVAAVLADNGNGGEFSGGENGGAEQAGVAILLISSIIGYA